MKENHNLIFILILSTVFFAGTIFVIAEVHAEQSPSTTAREINIPPSNGTEIQQSSSTTAREINIPPSNDTEIQTIQEKYNKLALAALRDGRVRIIVELDIDFQLEGKLRSEQEKMDQRERIKGIQNSVMQTLPTDGLISRYDFKYIPYVAVTVNKDALDQLLSSPLVKSFHEDKIEKPTLGASIPLIGADDVFTSGFDGTGKIVAILDTGVDKTHSFFSDGAGGNRIVSEACYTEDIPAFGTFGCPDGDDVGGADDAEETGPGTAAPCTASGCFHGTHVAGIAAGNDLADPTFSGVARGADIIAIQVFTTFTKAGDCFPDSAPCIGAFVSDSMKGLERVLELDGLGFDVTSANLSLGGGKFFAPCDSDPRKSIIDDLRLAGIATVISSGNNDFEDALSAPACISSAISVGSTTVDSHGSGLPDDSVSTFSNSAFFLDLLAPGQVILSSVPGGAFGLVSGTSMAAPHVAGAFALLKQAVPTASVDDILVALKTTGIPVLEPEGGITKPRIQLDDALTLLESQPYCNRSLSDFDTIIIGTAGNDRISGTSGDDLIDGRGGNDHIKGNDGDDCLIGGDGNDRLSGGNGNDHLQGNAGDDSLNGGPGEDVMSGGAGNDRMSGGPDNDEIDGGDGDDHLTGRDGNDLLFGDGDNDILSGGPGNDTIDGGSGDDNLLGRTGDDDMFGGTGSDVCVGGSGTDTADVECEIVF